VQADFAAVADDGGSAILSYSLEMDSGGGYSSVVGDPSDSLALTFTVNSGITSGQAYSFWYRAKNVHGWSGYSPVATIYAATEPDAPASV